MLINIQILNSQSLEFFGSVFSLMHRAWDDDSDISDSATDLLGGLEQGSAAG